MMRLRKLPNSGAWTILAPVDDDDSCEVLDDLNALASNNKTRATAAGFRALWSRITHMGPKSLGTPNYHRIDDANQINEFIKRNHRILCFEADGSLVVCSHVILKTSQKTKQVDKQRAIRLRDEFLQAKAAGSIEILEDE